MKPQVLFSDFSKLDIRVGEIIEVSIVEGSEKLVGLQVDFGEELGQKTIYAGVKPWFDPPSLAGRKLAFIVNLAPKKFKIGDKEYESNGMLIAADPGGKAVLYVFDEDLPPGVVLR